MKETHPVQGLINVIAEDINKFGEPTPVRVQRGLVTVKSRQAWVLLKVHYQAIGGEQCQPKNYYISELGELAIQIGWSRFGRLPVVARINPATIQSPRVVKAFTNAIIDQHH